jgi:hypothetical protein
VAFDLGTVTKGELNDAAIDTTVLNFVVGPRYTFQPPRLAVPQPLVQAPQLARTLISWVAQSSLHLYFRQPPQIPTVQSQRGWASPETGFAMLAVGGLDIKVNKAYVNPPSRCRLLPDASAGLLTQNLPGPGQAVPDGA